MSLNTDDPINKIRSLPKCIDPSVIMTEPNQEIPIHSGEFQVRQESVSISVLGSINFAWYPHKGAKFETSEILSNPNDISKLDISSKCQLYIDGMLFGDAYIQNIQDFYFLKGSCNQATWMDTTIKVSSIWFSVPNLLLSDGEQIQHTEEGNTSWFRGRTFFDNGIYQITIDKSKTYDKQEQSLQASGGYMVTCGGEIRKKNGPISLSDIKELLLSFNTFLSFINARQTSLYFLKGTHDDEVIWADYTSYVCNPYQGVRRWARVTDLKGLNHSWYKFYSISQDPDKREFLTYAIHWYLEANSLSGNTEGSIIFAQTGLELFYNWLLIEQRKLIIGSDAANLSAANKVRLLLSQMQVPPTIPVNFTHLNSLKDVPNQDGPEIFTVIRNALVHGHESKRKELKKINSSAMYEALELGTWYLELSLLYILEYKGRYSDRTSKNFWFGSGEVLPWQNNLE